MSWNWQSWNHHLRTIRRSLAKRDALTLAGEDGTPPPAGTRQLRRERKAWAERARADLKALTDLAREAPDRPRAEETVRELIDWYEKPPA